MRQRGAATRNVPSALTDWIWRQSANVISWACAKRRIPATWQSASRLAKRASHASTVACTEASSRLAQRAPRCRRRVRAAILCGRFDRLAGRRRRRRAPPSLRSAGRRAPDAGRSPRDQTDRPSKRRMFLPLIFARLRSLRATCAPREKAPRVRQSRRGRSARREVARGGARRRRAAAGRSPVS